MRIRGPQLHIADMLARWPKNAQKENRWVGVRFFDKSTQSTDITWWIMAHFEKPQDLLVAHPVQVRAARII